MDYINELHELCETIMNEIVEANDKIREAGGRLTAGDVEYVDKVTHTLKSIKSTIAMMENEDMGNSYDGGRGYSRMDGSYRGDGYEEGYDRRSYARGRGRYANRDSMGRYSSRGYSRDDGMVKKLRELMNDAPNEQIKKDFHRLIEKLEQEG